mmetsp:Transcript_32482/g.76443  ORF Transcript_32482/g.76443 Transcript_32482/m.76443 type:complete len:234 (+) Transcript_32482:1145-1846(+)
MEHHFVGDPQSSQTLRDIHTRYLPQARVQAGGSPHGSAVDSQTTKEPDKRRGLRRRHSCLRRIERIAETGLEMQTTRKDPIANHSSPTQSVSEFGRIASRGRKDSGENGGRSFPRADHFLCCEQQQRCNLGNWNGSHGGADGNAHGHAYISVRWEKQRQCQFQLRGRMFSEEKVPIRRLPKQLFQLDLIGFIRGNDAVESIFACCLAMPGIKFDKICDSKRNGPPRRSVGQQQ